MLNKVEQTSYADVVDPRCSFCTTGVGHTVHEHLYAVQPTLVERLDAMDSVDVCMWLEEGDLLNKITTKEEAKALLKQISSLRHSTGSYGRLCVRLEEAINANDE